MTEDSHQYWPPSALAILLTVSSLIVLVLTAFAYKAAIEYCLPCTPWAITISSRDCGFWFPDLWVGRRRDRDADQDSGYDGDDDVAMDQFNYHKNYDSSRTIDRDMGHEAREQAHHNRNHSNVSLGDTSDNYSRYSPVHLPRVRHIEEVRFHMDIVEEENSIGLQRPRRVRCRWQVFDTAFRVDRI
ncbi:hypothetical protein DPV78_007750 [Talaromyces pinophilus]|nr:hypothetical protein DPV78_007750 [Talaromyces pinophilus]